MITLRDLLVHGIRDDATRQKLLGKKKLTLTKCLEILRSSQVTSQQAQEIAFEETPTHAVRQARRSGRTAHSRGGHHKQKSKAEKGAPRSYDSYRQKSKGKPTECRYCGLNHTPGKKSCPAADQECHKCHKRGHYARVCHTPQRVHNTTSLVQPAVEYVILNHIRKVDTANAELTFRINEKDLAVQIDTLSQHSIMYWPPQTWSSKK